MKTKLIRVYETDYKTIEAIRRALVMQGGGVNRPTAAAVSHALKEANIPTDQAQVPAEARQE